MIAEARAQQIRQFLAKTEFKDGELFPLAGDASFRRYIRIRLGHKSAMLMDAPPEKENVRPYLAVAEYLKSQGYSAPAILAADSASGLLLLEDLGDDSFTLVLKACAPAKRDAQERILYEAAIDLLAEWHKGRPDFVNPKALPLAKYDETLLLREVRLFADWYLPQVLGIEKAAALAEEYMQLWETILASAPLAHDQWVHRDYHADNLMWLPARSGVLCVGLLDFQDSVYGDAAYDLASLLEDARRDVSQSLTQAMLARYIAATGADKTRFMTAYAVLAAQRNSKIIGIFVRLAARDNKTAYLNFLPRVWKYMEHDLQHPALQPLKAWIDAHIPAGARGAIAVKHNSQALALSA